MLPQFHILDLVNLGAIGFVALLVFALDLHGSLSMRALKIITFLFIAYLASSAILRSIVQWESWASTTVTKNFLPPAQPFYFYMYSFGRFFISPIFAVFSAFCFGGIMYMFEFHSKTKWISREDVWLSILAGLLVGWPNIILLVVFSFVLMLVSSVGFRARQIAFAPFLYASMVLLIIFGPQLMRLFQLTVLKT